MHLEAKKADEIGDGGIHVRDAAHELLVISFGFFQVGES
jgi:hypothetical protein